MLNYLIYNGRCSREFGVYISGDGAFGVPERDVEAISVPGRNGDLILDNGRYKNIKVSYPAFIREDFTRQAQAAAAWLCKPVGYCRLEDTYHPDSYRLARFVGPMDFAVRPQLTGGEMTLLFDAKPQRYLRIGDEPIIMLDFGTIANPTGFPALPHITVRGWGSGSLQIGSQVITFEGLTGEAIVDSDLMTAPQNTSLNEFPTLPMGEIAVSWSGGIRQVEITPRWWTI